MNKWQGVNRFDRQIANKALSATSGQAVHSYTALTKIKQGSAKIQTKLNMLLSERQRAPQHQKSLGRKEKGRAGEEMRGLIMDAAGRRSAAFRHRAQLGGGERTRWTDI